MDIGVVIGGGFRVIRDKPLAFFVWAIAVLLLFIPTMFLMRPMREAQAQAQAQMQGMPGNPQAQLAAMGVMMGRILLLLLVMLIVYVIMFAGVHRSALKTA